VWRLYGWYCGLMVCGSCFGIVTWSTRMVNLLYYFEGNDAYKNKKFTEAASTLAIAYRWRAAWVVSYAIDYTILTAARLLVLDQMSDFAAPKMETARKWWILGGRGVMAVGVLGNFVGIAANIVSAVYCGLASEDMSTAFALHTAGKSSDGQKFDSSGRASFQKALQFASYQSWCEVVVLMVVLAAFLAAGVLSARRLSKAVSVRAPAITYTRHLCSFDAVNRYFTLLALR
jgi:hypothetical protein